MTRLATEKVQQIIADLVAMEDLQQRRMSFFQLCQFLPELDSRAMASLLPLLDDWDFEIRREAAFWIDLHGIAKSRTEQKQLLYAFLQFDTLKYGGDSDSLSHRLLVKGLQDRSPRVREKVLRVFHINDCENDEEVLLYWYARGDYMRLLQLARDRQLEDKAREILYNGLSPRRNIPYHQRQCALALQQLGEQVIPPAKPSSSSSVGKDESFPLQNEERSGSTPLEQFLSDLNRKGVPTIEGRIHPTIHVGSITGRITYRDPGVQNWSEEKKIKMIRSEPDQSIWRFDFEQIEPRLLLHFLVQNFWLSLPDLPNGDVYDWVGIADREEAKRRLNRLINGGRERFPENVSRQFLNFYQAMENFRLELMEISRGEKCVRTISGRSIPIDPQSPRFSRRVMNTLIQGSAADFFNEAMVALHAHLELEAIPAEILLLVYDEVWLAVKKGEETAIVKNIRDFLNTMWKKYPLFLPIHVRGQRLNQE